MKKSYLSKLHFILTIVLLIVVVCSLVSKNQINTTVKSVSEIKMTIDEKEYIFPLTDHTGIMYKTSDSSYVLISRGRFDELKHFYENTMKLETEEAGDQLFVNKDGIRYAVKKLTDDLKYFEYSVEAVY